MPSSDRVPRSRRVPAPRGHGRRARAEPEAPREPIFHLDDVTVSYGEQARRARRDLRHRHEGDHGADRPVGLRQVHPDPLPQPHERPHPERTGRGQGALPRRRTSTRPSVDAVEVRKRIGMVFQKPNPFPKSIYDNIAFGPRVLGMKGDMDEIVERALRHAALWDEVKDRLKTNAFGMSGRPAAAALHRARLAVEPDVILMDEPCSALDPISTGKIEDLMIELKRGLLDRDRDAQHAAGRARVRPDRVLHRRPRRGRGHRTGRWSSSTTPRRSSPTRPTRAPRRT